MFLFVPDGVTGLAKAGDPDVPLEETRKSVFPS